MMKRIVLCLLAALVVFAGTSCGKKETELHVYNWADYVNPEVITQFEKANNCRVIMDFFDSNEALYAKVKAGAVGYDLYICSSYMINVMYQQNMLKSLDHGKIDNLGNVDKQYLKLALDKDMQYSVPYMMSFAGIAYNKDKVKNFKASWSMFGREDLKGRMTLLNDVRETVGAALKFNGFSYNTLSEAELAKARDTVIKWKKNIAKFEVDEAKRGLDAGEFFLIHTYNGDALQLMDQNKKLAFAVPEEGTSLSCDDMVIPETAQNIKLAYAFINFMLDPAVSAKNMEYINYLAPNTAAQKLMPEEFLKNPAVNLPASIVKKSDVLKDLGAENVKYSKVWDEIKMAQ